VDERAGAVEWVGESAGVVQAPLEIPPARLDEPGDEGGRDAGGQGGDRCGQVEPGDAVVRAAVASASSAACPPPRSPGPTPAPARKSRRLMW
jgi:hypothetical protein